MGSERGHRVVAHTADVIVEAWGPDLCACVEEAVDALLSLCVDPQGTDPRGRHTVRLDATDDENALLAALDEVIFVLDTSPDPPVRARVHRVGDESLELTLELADRATVESTGAGPKAVARSQLSVTASPEGVRCSFLVDV